MKRKIFRTFLVAGFLILLAVPSIQAQTTASEEVDIPLPEGVELQKQSDVTAAMFSRLFGQPWTDIVGESQSDVLAGGLGFYSGLVVSILKVLNLAAMAFVAITILYLWGIFAVTTAHEGKKLGGSKFNSLWIPVRHALSFSLVAPVFHGLSLMQVALIACVSLSINMANVVWDASGKYIISHLNTGIMDTASPMVETEVYGMVGPMFETSVIQYIEHERREKAWHPDIKPYTAPLTNVTAFEDKGFGSPLTDVIIVNENGVQDSDGAFVWLVDHENGRITVIGRPTETMSFNDMGGFVIPHPSLALKEERMTEGGIIEQDFKLPSDREEAEIYNLHRDIVVMRAKELTKFWGKIRQNAKAYLSCETPVNTGCVLGDCKTPLSEFSPNPKVHDSVKNYLQSQTKALSGLVHEGSGKISDVKDSIAKVLDSDLQEGSRMGWTSAGLFTFTLASVQKKINSKILQPATYRNFDTDAKDQTTGWLRLFKDEYSKQYDRNERAAVNGMQSYVSSTLLSGANFQAENRAQAQNGVETGSGLLKTLSTQLGKYFVASPELRGKDNAPSILGMTLREFGSYDPIVVIQSFGDRLLAVSGAVIGTGAILSFKFGEIVGIGIGLLILFIGILFAYVAPITPVIYWLRALLSWAFMVIECIVAAPFWTCSHALPEGEGFAGSHARRGYLMLFDILIRPTLLVIGAVFAIAIIQALGALFVVLFNSWFATIVGTYLSINFVADIVFSVLLISMMFYLSFTVFTKGITYLPERVMHWVGGGSGGGIHGEEQDTKTIIVAGGSFSRIQSAGMGSRGIGRGLKAIGDKVTGKNNATGPRGSGSSTGANAPVAQIAPLGGNVETGVSAASSTGAAGMKTPPKAAQQRAGYPFVPGNMVETAPPTSPASVDGVEKDASSRASSGGNHARLYGKGSLAGRKKR